MVQKKNGKTFDQICDEYEALNDKYGGNGASKEGFSIFVHIVDHDNGQARVLAQASRSGLALTLLALHDSVRKQAEQREQLGSMEGLKALLGAVKNKGAKK